MSGFVQGRYKTFFINACNNSTDWILAGRVEDCEVLAEIAEDGSEEAEGVGNDKVDVVLVAVIANNLLIWKRSAREDNNLVFVES